MPWPFPEACFGTWSDGTEKAPLARPAFVFERVSLSGRPIFCEAVCAPREGGQMVILTSA